MNGMIIHGNTIPRPVQDAGADAILQRKRDCSSGRQNLESEVTRSAINRDSMRSVLPGASEGLSSLRQPGDAGSQSVSDFSRVPASSSPVQSLAPRTPSFSKFDFQTPGTPVTPSPSPIIPLALPPRVDRITIIDGPTGATTGYPAIMGNSDLNVPGPFNHAPTGEVKNVHQIKFHLDQGNSSALTPTRIVRATFSRGSNQARYPPDQPGDPGGFAGTRTQNDGPPTHEIRRPTSDTIVIADSPGPRSLGASDYPFGLSADFNLTVAAGGTDIARIRYEVKISKTSATNIPNAENSVRALEKEDIVRQRSIV
jgi:hypothetical protein